MSLPRRERQLDLGPRSAEVDARGHERQAPLRGLAHQPLDLAPVEQQLARALGIVVLARGLVGRDVHVAQPDLAVAHLGVGVLELDAAGAQRLDLRALQHDPGLEPLEQVVAKAGLAVGGHVAGRRLALAFFAIRPTSMQAGERSTRPRGGLDPVDRHLDRVAQAEPAARALVLERGAQLVQRPPAAQPARGQKPSKPSSPKRTKAPFSIRPTTSPSNVGDVAVARPACARAGRRGTRRRRRARSSSPRARSPS